MPELQRIRTRTDFAEALSDLRRRSGFTIRKLGAMVGAPPTTVHGWFTGRHLPYTRDDHLFRKVLQVLGVDDTEPWWAVLDRLRRGVVTSSVGLPYVGLRSYTADEAALFHGRDGLVELTHQRFRLVAHERQSGQPGLLFLIGPSGAGKTSLLNAGLRPRLAADGRTVGAMRPGGDPVTALRRALEADVDTLLVDQFEELFTLSSPADRAELLEALSQFASRAGNVVVAVVRSDFLGDLTVPPLLASSLSSHVVVPPPNWPDMLACVTVPAATIGATVDPALLAALERDVVLAVKEQGGAGSPLPHVSTVLARALAASDGARLTLESYRSAGGVQRAVEQSAEEVYSSLSAAARAAWSRIALLLVHVRPEGAVVRRPAGIAELVRLLAWNEADDGLDELLTAFTDAGILTVREGEAELTHEVLLISWPRLRRLIDEHRPVLALREDLVAATRAWRERDRDDAGLLRSPHLERLRVWLEPTLAGLLSDDELDLLQESHARELQRRRERQRFVDRAMALSAAMSSLAPFVSAGGSVPQ
jgi:hypothetical protein